MLGEIKGFFFFQGARLVNLVNNRIMQESAEEAMLKWGRERKRAGQKGCQSVGRK